MASVKVPGNPEKKADVSAKDLGGNTQPTYGERKSKGKQLFTGWLEDPYYGILDALQKKWGLSSHTDVVKEALRRAYRGQ